MEIIDYNQLVRLVRGLFYFFVLFHWQWHCYRLLVAPDGLEFPLLDVGSGAAISRRWLYRSSLERSFPPPFLCFRDLLASQDHDRANVSFRGFFFFFSFALRRNPSEHASVYAPGSIDLLPAITFPRRSLDCVFNLVCFMASRRNPGYGGWILRHSVFGYI